MAGMTPSTTIVLIHGPWMTPLAWEHWVERYEARGCTVLIPGYPGAKVPGIAEDFGCYGAHGFTQ